MSENPCSHRLQASPGMEAPRARMEGMPRLAPGRKRCRCAHRAAVDRRIACGRCPRRPGQADAFLKSEVIDAFSELGDEIARLRWLQAQGQPAPTVIATAEEEGAAGC